jgi:hypothetical protein
MAAYSSWWIPLSSLAADVQLSRQGPVLAPGLPRYFHSRVDRRRRSGGRAETLPARSNWRTS